MTTADQDLASTPVVDATERTAPATATSPAQAVPQMPPPAGLLEGERRAADGGVERIPTE